MMDLFKKVELFAKQAQTSVVDHGIQPHYVRQVAQKIVDLIKQNKASLPPEVSSNKPNSLIDLIGDYLGGRFADAELDRNASQHLLSMRQLLDRYATKYPANKAFFETCKQEIIKGEHSASGVTDSGITDEVPMPMPTSPAYMPSAEEEKKMMQHASRLRMKMLSKLAIIK